MIEKVSISKENSFSHDIGFFYGKNVFTMNKLDFPLENKFVNGKSYVFTGKDYCFGRNSAKIQRSQFLKILVGLGSETCSNLYQHYSASDPTLCQFKTRTLQYSVGTFIKSHARNHQALISNSQGPGELEMSRIRNE